ncbi:MAG TPA: hypothetical protein VFE78_12830, partial [Gemmataceae bacterium]|nr:hypothetical protein [Gemmataceae bacterium]
VDAPEVAGLAEAGAGVEWCTLAVVAVAGLVVVVVGEVVLVVVVGSADVVVVSATSVVGAASVPLAPALSERWMAGSPPRWGTPAMATPTAAHTTSMSAVIDRCPGLTAGPSRRRR